MELCLSLFWTVYGVQEIQRVKTEEEEKVKWTNRGQNKRYLI